MFNKIRRYLIIGKVIIKYNLLSLLYNDLGKAGKPAEACSNVVDVKKRSNAKKLRLAFEELGPTYIKLGQTLSKRPDMVPHSYIEELGKLQDNVKVLDFTRMRETFETKCVCNIANGGEEHSSTCYHHNDILEMFDEFDTTPIASASIGQVYKAVLNGKDVAVKIARPNLIDTINVDLEIIYDIKPLLIRMMGLGKNFNADVFLQEFEDMLHRELDYMVEAMNIKRFRENFKDVEDVLIPDVYLDHCRENILVMDFMEGVQIKDIVDVDLKTRSKYASLISSSYLKQVYIDGFYHADPHGGNILVKDGTIAFIDFGAVGKIDGTMIRNMLNLFHAMYISNVDVAADVFLKIGNSTRDDIDLHRFKWDLDDLIAKQHYQTGERQSDNYAKLALKYNMSMPSEFSTLERALMLIESVCLDLDSNYSLMAEAKPMIARAMKERYSIRRIAGNLQMEIDEYMEIFKNLPAGINDVIETIQGYKVEKLRGKSDILGKYRLLDDFSKYIFLSVLVVSSAYLVVRGEASLNLLGIGGFVGAVLMGIRSLLRS
ncbi:MAG TPA: AarF/ABC1/UbiB kinase family protein [Methanosarcinaceae archaeon]|nr:AarF/ABC1/UbiB kinase family protein [Methanosarcinaceae archaeon]